jgi:3-phenylpropionate/trans-cinnamate dioxygenase ferredoxin subunit
VGSYVDVAATVDVPDGGLLGVTLYKRHGEIGALGGRCTHAEFAMADGVLHDDGTIECAWHGARFDCRSGAVRRHPATDPLPIYAVRVEHGRVLVGAPLTGIAERSA